jgi:hypothetical protein
MDREHKRRTRTIRKLAKPAVEPAATQEAAPTPPAPPLLGDGLVHRS